MTRCWGTSRCAGPTPPRRRARCALPSRRLSAVRAMRSEAVTRHDHHRLRALQAAPHLCARGGQQRGVGPAAAGRSACGSRRITASTRCSRASGTRNCTLPSSTANGSAAAKVREISPTQGRLISRPVRHYLPAMAGTDKSQQFSLPPQSGGDPVRAATRREHRHHGARHGQFRAVGSAAGQPARRLAQRAGDRRSLARRPRDRARASVRNDRGGDRRPVAGLCHHGAPARPAKAGTRARGSRAAGDRAYRYGRQGGHPVRARALGPLQ